MWGIDATVLLLFVGIFGAVAALIYIEHMFKGEANCFQVIAGLITAFSSSLFTKLKVDSGKPPDEVKKEDKPNV
jgi:hypothetical protein